MGAQGQPGATGAAARMAPRALPVPKEPPDRPAPPGLLVARGRPVPRQPRPSRSNGAMVRRD